MWQIRVPAIRFYSPPIACARLSDAVRRAKQIAAAHPGATVDIFRNDGLPVFAIGASRFGAGCPDVTPHRSYAEFCRINRLAK